MPYDDDMPEPASTRRSIDGVNGAELRLWMPAVMAVVKRPDLWATALRQSLNLAPKRWWTRRPWLPLPAADYLRFRMLTAYGHADRGPEAHDVITWLEWSRSWKSVTGAGRVPTGAQPNPAELTSGSN